jgi:hypothetical protein
LGRGIEKGSVAALKSKQADETPPCLPKIRKTKSIAICARMTSGQLETLSTKVLNSAEDAHTKSMSIFDTR